MTGFSEIAQLGGTAAIGIVSIGVLYKIYIDNSKTLLKYAERTEKVADSATNSILENTKIMQGLQQSIREHSKQAEERHKKLMKEMEEKHKATMADLTTIKDKDEEKVRILKEIYSFQAKKNGYNVHADREVVS